MVKVYALTGTSVQSSSSSSLVLHCEDCMVVLGTITGEGLMGDLNSFPCCCKEGNLWLQLIKDLKIWDCYLYCFNQVNWWSKEIECLH